MEFSKEYKVSVFNNGEGKELADYNVRFKAEGKKTIRVNVKELLLMVPGKELLLANGRVKFKMLDMRSVKIDEEEYSGFHEMREKIRAYIKKRGLMRQLEEINRIIAIDEFKAYLGMKEGEYIGFSKYFRERFPEESKIRFSYNIGYMFGAYQREFEKDDVPKQEYSYYETEFRTRDRGFGDYYVYPIRVRHVKKEATYFTKAAICMLYEMEVA